VLPNFLHYMKLGSGRSQERVILKNFWRSYSGVSTCSAEIGILVWCTMHRFGHLSLPIFTKIGMNTWIREWANPI